MAYGLRLNDIVPSLPVAGIEDFLGLLVFVVYAVVYTLVKRAREGGGTMEEEEELPTQKFPQRDSRPVRPSPLPPPISRPAPVSELDKKIRQYRERLEQVKKEKSLPPKMPAPSRPSRPSPIPVLVPSRQMPREEPPPLVVAETEETFHSPVAQTIHQETERSMANVLEAVTFSSEELQIPSAEIAYAEPPTQETGTESPSRQILVEWLRTPASLKRSVVLAEILGSPRGQMC